MRDTIIFVIIYHNIGVVSLGSDHEAPAATLVDTIGDFAMQENPTSLRLVRITIFKPEMFSVYKDILDSKADPRRRQNKGAFLRGIGKYPTELPV